MRKLNRLPCPDFLKDKWEQWGCDWAERRKTNPSASFHWHQLDNVPVNQLLLPKLREQTQDHCSFCDAFPVSPPSSPTIEHFHPKLKFPLKAYEWENLYFCCCFCQTKGDEFYDKLLRPDAPDYSFERYFNCNYIDGNIEVNSLASPEDQERAKVTMELYKLNVGHPRCRRLAMRERSKSLDSPLDDFAYRDFLKS
jgi:uncharacterized protein (TIGR02646 family)